MACVACHTSHCRLALHPNPTAIGQRYLLTSPNVRYAMTLGDYELAPNLSNAEKPADNKYQKTDSVVCEFEPAFAAPPYSPQVAF